MELAADLVNDPVKEGLAITMMNTLGLVFIPAAVELRSGPDVDEGDDPVLV